MVFYLVNASNAQVLGSTTASVNGIGCLVARDSLSRRKK